MTVKNPVAKALRSGVCRPQVIPAKKGKGAYKRKRMTPEARRRWLGLMLGL